jgi:uncharacterized SAM-binding protein YcdF (DUF218 family)
MDEVDKNAKIIWDYMLMHHELKKVDAIIALGTNDIRVVDRAFEIWKLGFASTIICTGGMAHMDDINKTGWEKSEAEIYKDRLVELGVPESSILTETQAKSTGDNAILTKKLLQEKNLNFNDFILVTKPWMERRAYATFRKQWPEANILLTSVELDYDTYMNSSKDVAKEIFLNVMVGDFQRINEYPKRSFQIEQEIPDSVWHAYERLVLLGFNKYLIK